MANIADRFLTHIEYDNAPFNVEFFWDPETDHIWLLEVNTRISESHTDLFLKVDGASHHEVATDLSLGERPRIDRKSTRLNSSHVAISYAVFCLKKKNILTRIITRNMKMTNITYNVK